MFSREGFYSSLSDNLFRSLSTPTRRGFLSGVAATAAAGAMLGGSRPAFAADNGADVIFVDGTIAPMTGAGTVGALAIGGGKVLAAGSPSTVMGLKTKNTKIVDLDGRTVMPGFVDPFLDDGSDQTETGAQTQDYLNSKSKGATNYPADQLKTMVAEIKAFGMPVLIHCNGDLAIDNALDAIEAAYQGSTALGINRIEHSTMARADQIQRMKKLGVQPSFFMNHLRLYGAAFRDDIFGPERANNVDPTGWCAKSGVPFSFHTDSPCSPLGALTLAETAVTRRCIIDNSILGKDQAVSVDHALRAITIDAAKQCGMGDRIGSLEKGKEADLVILEDNPYKVDPETISKIKISETWVGGQKKFG